MKEIKGGVTAARGYKAAGISCGIKKDKIKDLALIYSAEPAVSAGVFTLNKIVSPSVKLNKEKIGLPTTQAIIVNSGNANACVGNQGYSDAKEIVKQTAEQLGISSEEVLIASTGVIGEPLPVENIKSGIPDLIKALGENGNDNAAAAILTTDTVAKTVAVEIELDGAKVKIGGITKGSGMIHPNMATMLGFITTDALIEKTYIQKLLKEAVDKSFNMITVDGDCSTNDSVIVLANGLAKNKIITENHPESKKFSNALEYVAYKLARKIVEDGEGATKLIEVSVIGAKSYEDAKIVAFAIAQSSLVKTAFFGEDANWGRIVAAAGGAGVSFDYDRAELFFGKEQVVKNGVYCGAGREKEIDKVIKEKEIKLILNINSGSGEATVLTCDLSYDYVKINADYRS